MAALGGGEEERKEKTKSLSPPPNGTTQRQWRNLTERWKKAQRKKIFCQKREKSFSWGGTVEDLIDEELLLGLLKNCIVQPYSYTLDQDIKD